MYLSLLLSKPGAQRYVTEDLTDRRNFTEIDDILSTPSQTHESIDNALRAFIGFTTNFKGTATPLPPPNIPGAATQGHRLAS